MDFAASLTDGAADFALLPASAMRSPNVRDASAALRSCSSDLANSSAMAPIMPTMTERARTGAHALTNPFNATPAAFALVATDVPMDAASSLADLLDFFMASPVVETTPVVDFMEERTLSSSLSSPRTPLATFSASFVVPVHEDTSFAFSLYVDLAASRTL